MIMTIKSAPRYYHYWHIGTEVSEAFDQCPGQVKIAGVGKDIDAKASHASQLFPYVADSASHRAADIHEAVTRPSSRNLQAA
jgi:hypothetical protein